jgi:ribosomal protein S18 acetylase RimI-like enzyme
MVSTALDFLEQNGMRYAQLQVRTDNRDALNLYEKLDFVILQESGIYTRKISGTW